ncbi:McrC family protein [Pseudomonas sp. RC10]|uniref:McrC family protein n=1 Tax=Pseudomonas bambusae TaxID=3139142 RepID=UPI00313928FE
MTGITVREHALLTLEPVTPSLDRAQVSPSAFDWLCELSASFKKNGASLVQRNGQRSLRLDNYVGVVETPCGTRLEILPKHRLRDDCLKESRGLLQKMIQVALDLPVRQAGPASLERFDTPTPEWVMRQFLQALDHLVKRGMRSDYRTVEAQEPFLRGQLNVVAQMRQQPGREHLFQIRHDAFQPDGAENRLLSKALERVCEHTRDPDNWRMAHELRHLLHEVPASTNIPQDFKRWRTDRLMTHYTPIKPWCELILGELSPLSVHGNWHGISVLFPMEKLFERYLEAVLRRSLTSAARLTPQPARHSLCSHQGQPLFQLRPDFILEHEGVRWVLDAKWKLLDQTDRDNKYGLKQSDLYQLFAYGQRYLEGKGDLVLVYPKHDRFTQALAPFYFTEDLRLWVVPFDLLTDQLITPEQTGSGSILRSEMSGMLEI